MNLNSHEIPCVILCGGKSSRMGEDKALLPFANFTSLTAYQYDRLNTYFKTILLSSKTNKFDFDVPIIYDNTNEVSSPMVALKSILEHIKENKVFIITVDTPFVSVNTINEIIKQSKDFDITYASTKKDHYLCGVYSKNILEKIEKLLSENKHKISNLIDQSTSKKIIFGDDKEFLNLNNKSDYEEAINILN